MNYKLLVDLAILAGEIMLLSGAETYRVEDTIAHILKTSELEHCEAFVLSTGIMVTLGDPGIDTISMVKRIGEKNTSLGNIYQVNKISRMFCNKELSLEEAYLTMQKVTSKKRYEKWLINLCIIVTAAGFTMLLGGNVLECAAASLNGVFILLGDKLYQKIRINHFVINMLVSFIIALSSLSLQKIFGNYMDMEPVIAGSIMILLPGVAVTNAIRDTLQGDYMSGGARVIEAFVTAASLAVGIGGGLAFAGTIMGGVS